ncbi:MAG: AMIN domain-containing protein, partial [Alphaproteobacteria bacterium]|nr:AMIN domain-containing protein [Alphaproteobacteria bacterium]
GLLFFAAAIAQPRSEVRDIDAQAASSGLTVSVGFDRSTPAKVFILPDPVRLVVDLPLADIRIEPPGPLAGGAIDRVRFGQPRPGERRIVFDLKSTHVVASAQFLGERLVIALRPASGAAYDQGIRRQVDLMPDGAAPAADRPKADAEPPSPSKIPPRTVRKPEPPPRHVVALDPGHGGVDPGTIGATGAYEKNVTLAIAHEARRHLEASGRFKVIMTRSDDTFVPLGERVAIAQRAKAELLISLHADSIASATTRGGSVYTLSEKASDDRARALAAKENAADLLAGITYDDKDEQVNKILLDLARRETDKRSIFLASDMLAELSRNSRLLERSHRSAGFRVLKSHEVPSILVEMGYLSNREDEKILLSKDGQRRIALSVARAAEAYFKRKLE